MEYKAFANSSKQPTLKTVTTINNNIARITVVYRIWNFF